MGFVKKGFEKIGFEKIRFWGKGDLRKWNFVNMGLGKIEFCENGIFGEVKFGLVIIGFLESGSL